MGWGNSMNTEHGIAEISVNGERISVVLEGSFNRQGVLKYQARYREIVQSFGDEPFKVFLNCLSIDGATPDAFEEIDNFNAWLNKRNIKAKAMVMSSAALTEIAQKRLPQQNKQNIRIFSTTDAALSWLDLV